MTGPETLSKRQFEAAASLPVSASYTGVAIALHWLIAAMILVTIPLGLFGASVRTDAGQAATDIHKPLGLVILALTIVRIAWRLWHAPPALPEAVSALQRAAAKTVQAALYALLIVMPISGWWMTSAFHKHTVDFFGLFAVPYLPVEPGMPAAAAAHGVHELFGWTLILLVALHTTAALKHHYIVRDDVLRRMVPRGSRALANTSISTGQNAADHASVKAAAIAKGDQS